MLSALPTHALAITVALQTALSTSQGTQRPETIGVQAPAPDAALPELGFDAVNYSLRVLPGSPEWVAVPPSDLNADGSYGLGMLVSQERVVDILAFEDAEANLKSLTDDLESELEASLGVDLALAKSGPVEGWCLAAIDSVFVPDGLADAEGLVMAYRTARRGAFFYTFNMVGYSGADAALETFRSALKNIDILAEEPVGSSKLPFPADAIGSHWVRSAGIFEDYATCVRATAQPDWRMLGSEELRAQFYDSALGLRHRDKTFWASYTVVPLAPSLDPRNPRSARDWDALAMNGFLAADTEPTEFLFLGETLLAHHYERKQEGYSSRIARAGLERSGIGIALDFRYDGELESGDLARLLQESVGGFTAMDAARCKEVATQLQMYDAGGWIADERTLRGGSYRDFKRGMQWTPPTSNWKIAGPGKAERFGRSVRVFASDIQTGEKFIVHAFRSRPRDIERAWEKLVARTLGELTDGPFPTPVETKIGTRSGWMAEVPELTVGRVATLAMVFHGGVRYEVILWGPSDRKAKPATEAVFAGLRIPEVAETRSEFHGDAYTDRLLGFRIRAPSPEWSFEAVKMPRRDAADKGACTFLGPAGERVMVTAIYLDPEDEERTQEFLRASHLAGLLGTVEGMTSCQVQTFLGQRAVVLAGQVQGSEYQHAVFQNGNVLYQVSSRAKKGAPYPMAKIGSLLEFLP